MTDTVVLEGGRVVKAEGAKPARALQRVIAGFRAVTLILFAVFGALLLLLLLPLLAVVAAVVLLTTAFIGWLRRLIFPKASRFRRL